MDKLLATDNSWTGLILRVGLGVIMFPHGAQKLLGWFGGPGLDATITGFTAQMHIPWLFAVLVIAAEFFGSLGLIFGALSRIAAFGITCVMLGAIAMVHWQHGLFMNWAGTKGGEGFEFHLLAITIGIAIMLKGSGRWSIDRALQSRSSGQLPPVSEEKPPVKPA